MHELRPIKTHLFTPGPTPVPDEVLRAMAAPVIHHRTPAFQAVLQEVLDGIPRLFGTTNAVAMFTASGTGAMESAVANLVNPGDVVLVAQFGRFGQRWAEIARAYGATVQEHATEWGERPDPEAIAAFVAEHPDAVALFTTHSETSTGTVSDAGAIASAVRGVRDDLLLVLDAISSLGAVECRADEWGYDVVVAGSQKALMLPPGLAFACVSERAEARAQQVTSPAFYLSWQKALDAHRKSPASTPFTPALTIVLGAQVALRMIFDEGLDAVYARHIRLGRATRAAMGALGFDLFGPDDDSSAVLTAVRVPEDVDGTKIPATLRTYGVTIAGGQVHLKGRIFRLGHCGWVNDLDLVLGIAALERGLVELGMEIEAGAGVSAAQRVLLGADAEVRA
jgi:serine---pyruvate transaminase